MVARRSKSSSESSSLNVRVELDNKALKAKNTTLTQTVAKLQQDNAELLKQLTSLQREHFDVSTKYNNLKNVVSGIDSTSKLCLSKFNDIVNCFMGIIQLCNVGANITNYRGGAPVKEVRTQTVKPQIVNGHILQNPTITLSRLSNDNASSPRIRQSNGDVARPSTSNNSNEFNENGSSNDTRQENSDSDNSANDEEQDMSFHIQTRRSSHTKGPANLSEMQDDVDENEENEEPLEEEEEDNDSDPRLTTIHEAEEEDGIVDTELPRQQGILQGRFQEVRIYLHQLPSSCVTQSPSASNISISVSPPERRLSYKNRSSSLVGQANESAVIDGVSYLEEQPSSSRAYIEDNRGPSQTSRFDSVENNAQFSLSFDGPVTIQSLESLGISQNAVNLTKQYSENSSSVQKEKETSTSILVQNETNSMQSESFREMDMLHIQLQHKTSTPMMPRESIDGVTTSLFESFYSPNRAKSESSLLFKSNITKRRAESKRKIAQVLLNRLSLDQRCSKSPIQPLEDIVNIKSPSEVRSIKRKSKKKSRKVSKKTSEGGESKAKKPDEASARKRKQESPTKKISDINPKIKKELISPRKVSRPSRAAKPMNLREPSLSKKLRRSK